MSNTDVSRLLGEIWRSASHKERAPYVEQEEQERAIYKATIARWEWNHFFRCAMDTIAWNIWLYYFFITSFLMKYLKNEFPIFKMEGRSS